MCFWFNGSFCFIFYIIIYLEYFKKGSQKENDLQLTLQESYHYLGCCQDDTWAYIKQSFEKRMHLRRNHNFFEHYYQAYLLLAQHYEYRQGTIKDLTTQEKVFLVFRTIINTIKNIFGALAMPMYISLAILIFYIQNFNAASVLKIKTIIDVIPLGHAFYACIEMCYDIIVMIFPVSQYYAVMDLELAKMISFCICMTFLWAFYTILRTRIREIKRQYLRRLQFYLKRHAGIYHKDQKYPREYLYGAQFTIFLLFISIMIGLYQAFITSLPYPQQDVLKVMQHRQEVLTQIQPYVEKKNHILGNWDEYFSQSYLTIDSLTDLKVSLTHNKPYLKIYAYYTQADAQKIFDNECDQYKHISTKDQPIQYAYSSKGFIILDQTMIIKMKNDKSLIGKTMSQKEVKALIEELGYTLNT